MTLDIKTSAGLVSEGEFRIHVFKELSEYARNFNGTHQLVIYEAANQVLKGEYQPEMPDTDPNSNCGTQCDCQGC